MKKTLLLLIITLFSSCSLQHNLKARKLLTNCKYTLTYVKLDNLSIGPKITFNKNSKKISIEKPTIQLIPLLNELKEKRFNLDLSKFKFKIKMNIHNPNKQEVILDSMSVKVHCDETYVTTIAHKEYTEIPSNQSKDVRFWFDISRKIPLKKVLRSNQFILKANVWFNYKLKNGKSFRIPFSFTQSIDIPKKKIREAVNKQKEIVIKKMVKRIEHKIPSKQKNLLDGILKF